MIGGTLERAPWIVALVAIALLALSACGQEAERGHDDPTPHGMGPTAAAEFGASTDTAP